VEKETFRDNKRRPLAPIPGSSDGGAAQRWDPGGQCEIAPSPPNERVTSQRAQLLVQSVPVHMPGRECRNDDDEVAVI